MTKRLKDISRRGFLAGSALAASIAGGRFAAAQTEAPRAGGILSCLASADPPNFDPFSNTSGLTLNIVGACYSSLIMYNPAKPDEIIGDLAESWSVASDGLAYTFKLIRTAKFHDGRPVTSADVKFTFDTVRQPPAGVVSARKTLLAAIASIEAPDDYNVIIRLSRPSPALLSSLAGGWFVIAPKTAFDGGQTLKDRVVGSGPYMLKEYKRGVSIELVRNPNYHIKGRPYLDGIRFFTVPNPATAYSYLSTGQIDFYDGILGKEARRAEAELGGRVVVHKNASYIGHPYIVNTTRSPLANVDVRKALAMSVDHYEAVKLTIDGDGVVAGVVPPQPWGLSEDELRRRPGYWSDMTASRAEARSLLVKAGFPDGFSTTITTRLGVGTHDARGIFLADQFARIGVKARIVGLEGASYLDALRAGNFEIATGAITSLTSDPDFLIGDYHTCEGGQNFSRLCSAEIDRLFVAQSAAVDVGERRKLVHDLELATMDQFATVVLYFGNKFVATSRRVRGYVMPPEPDNNRRMQEVWLAQA